MTVTRVLLSAVLLLTAAVLQATVINLVQLPGGGPDLVLLVLIGLALVSEPTAAAVLGFCAGLLVDFMPPGVTEVGRHALVFCLVGYICGQVRMDSRRSPFVAVAVVALLSAFAVLAFAGIGLLFGDQRITAEIFVSTLIGTVLYDLLLAPFVIPVVMALARKTEPAVSRL